jgi:hypothetical protein
MIRDFRDVCFICIYIYIYIYIYISKLSEALALCSEGSLWVRNNVRMHAFMHGRI